MTLLLSKKERERLKNIVHVLYENDLGPVIARLGLRKYLPFTKHIKTEKFKHGGLTPKQLLKVFDDLGGSFIKLGQLLSLRPDLIPDEYCQSLSKLQDKVRPFAGKTAEEVVKKEFNRPISELFKEFDSNPIASASIGQVHRARLKDGTRVVVKVQRPNIQDIFDTDIKLLYRLAKLIKKRFGTDFIDPETIIKEFERYTADEMDYFKEAHNIDQFHKNFRSSTSIRIPKVFWDHCSDKVLTMEHLHGTLLSDIKIKSKTAKAKILKRILDSEFEQIFMHGFFHSDPHPGNFIVMKDGKVALIDFGIVGRLDSKLKDSLNSFYISLIKPDLEGMVYSAIDMGVGTPLTDSNQLKRDMTGYLSQFYDTPLDRIDISKVLSGLIEIFRVNHLNVPVDLILLAKATVTLEGVARGLDPGYNFVEHSRPFIRRLQRKMLNPKDIAEKISRKTRELVHFMDTVPRKSTVLLNELSSTDHDIRKIDHDLNVLRLHMDTSSNRVTLGFLAGCTFIASSLMLNLKQTLILGLPALSFFGFSLSLLLMLTLITSILRERHK